MPKEQVRKRGKRKPKNAEEGPLPGHSIPDAATDAVDQNRDVNDGADVAGPSGSAPAASASAGGIHPSRLALLKGGHRGSSSGYTAPATESGASAAPAGGEDGQQGGEEEGAAQWVRGPREESEFPFGVLDPDVKAYLRTVEEQIKDWEGSSSTGEEREDRLNFLSTVLGELRGHELPAATDPECSVVIERLLPSMGDWGRRVLGDAMAGSWEGLVRHRFSSHVLQSWIRLGAETLDREARGTFPPQEAVLAATSDQGSLRRMSALFVDLIATLRPILPTLLTSPHASPPLRMLLLALSPERTLPDSAAEGGDGAVRSKKSGKFRRNHGVRDRNFVDGDEGKGKGKETEARQLPEELQGLRREVREGLMVDVKENEWRIVGVDPAGSVIVQLLLDLEVDDGAAERAGSLLDTLTEGLVADLDESTEPSPKEYIPSLLTTQPGARLLEGVLQHAPERVFSAIWTMYFVGKLGRLAGHPLGNYVVARGVARLDAEQVKGVVREVKAQSGGRGLIKSGRTRALQSLVERATVLGDEDVKVEVIGLMRTAADLPEGQANALVPCLMTLKTHPTYQAILSGENVPADDEPQPAEAVDQAAEDQAAAAARYAAWQNRRNPKTKADGTELEPVIQGSLLLQSLAVMGRDEVFESLFAQSAETLMGYACHPIASRFLDAILAGEGVPAKWKRKLMMAFLGQYRTLVEDRIGSRVGDTIWANADGFMKEKIARSLLPHATALANSQFGRFYATKLKLHLLQRRPDEWKEEVIGVRHHFAHQKDAKAVSAVPVPAPAPAVVPVVAETEEEVAKREKKERREKRKQQKEAEGDDEIDALFAGATGAKKRRQA